MESRRREVTLRASQLVVIGWLLYLSVEVPAPTKEATS